MKNESLNQIQPGCVAERLAVAAQELMLLLLAAAIGFYAWRFGGAGAGWLRVCMCALLSGGFLTLAHVMLYGSERLKTTLWRRQWMLWLPLGVLWVALNLNNTSISQWLQWLPGEEKGLLWGQSRGIRSDEWAVWTPFLYSQAGSGYPAVNLSITGREVSAAWISVGGLPAFSPLLVFKPFYWGFLLFGAEGGYSLLALLRFSLLLWLSCRTALKYARGNRLLAITAAALVALSPYVQWWFSQSVCEVLIFAQGMVLLTDRYTAARSGRMRWLYASLAAWCLGCYIMVAYPAWLISVGYLLAAVLIRMLWTRRGALRPGDLWRLLPFAAVGIVLFICVREDWGTLLRVMRSEYPGGRLYTGGEVPQSMMTGLYSLLFPLRGTAVSNPCELSNMLTLAPAGLVLAVWRRLSGGKRDTLTALLALLEAALWAFQLFGCPAWLVRVSLLSQCTRNTLALCLCDLLLLIRGLSSHERQPWGQALCAASVCSLLCVSMLFIYLAPGLKSAAALLALYLLLFTLTFSGRAKSLLCALLIGLSVLNGAFVNPIQQGLSTVETLAPVEAIREAEAGEGALFAMEADWPVTNAAVFSGKPVLNATQPYADPERWRAADPEGTFASVYNRFCHVSLTVAEETSFTLLHEDHIRAALTLENLRALGVTHLVSRQAYPQLELTASADGWYVWRLEE